MSTVMEQAPARFAPTQSQLSVAYSVCRGIARSAARNFYYAFLVLPQPKRQALCAVYAFMRRCDDIADDESLTRDERRRKLALWLDAFHSAHAGAPTDEPVLLALTDAQSRYNIPVGLLDQLAYGTAMDLANFEDQSGNSLPGVTVHYSSFEALREYCYQVASVVGLVCIRIFGYRDPAAESLAEQLGIAFQLTNIIRDVKEDAAAGRIYLPEEDLAKFGISPSQLRAEKNPAKFQPLLAFEAERAREYYKSADELITLIDEDSQPGLWVLVTIYQALLGKIALRQYDVFSGKISLSMREKLRILLKGWMKRLA